VWFDLEQQQTTVQISPANKLLLYLLITILQILKKSELSVKPFESGV
jgi:hypothetical protein